MSHADFLVEIHTEELPPKIISHLATAFADTISNSLKKLAIPFGEVSWFATPRRFAVLVKNLSSHQPDTTVERKGPSLAAAFDQQHQPTSACLGFAKSCGVNIEALITIKNTEGSWMGYQQHLPGKEIKILLPDIIKQALSTLPIPKAMRWGNHADTFVRPVKSILMLYGDDIVPASFFGCETGRVTQGHRFHCKAPLSIKHPTDYADILKNKGYIIADFNERKEKIQTLAKKWVEKEIGKGAEVILSEALVNEVTGLVEWPVAIGGHFSKEFLNVPEEVLISAMQDHQRYFPIVDSNKKLLPAFVAIINLESHDVARVIAGNERVLRARLSDAAFFFQQDKKQSLFDYVEKLKGVLFQEKLGTLYDKVERLSILSARIAKKLNGNEADAKQAGLLSKADLVTDMVKEFPELQGVMAYYYALHENIPMPIALALKEHYFPRFSKDQLPETILGCALALSDRLDTLVGAFGMKQIPTGDKDPLGLRRAALGILRIMIEKKYVLDARELITLAASNYKNTLENHEIIDPVWIFMQERLKSWCLEQSIFHDVIASVFALSLSSPYDMICRMQAVTTFKKCPEAESLNIANKRVSQILKSAGNISRVEIDENLLEEEAERTLWLKIKEQQQKIFVLSKSAHYEKILMSLSELRHPIDHFFEKVMVMSEDQCKRENRLLLLTKLRSLFLEVADVALLQ